MVLLLAIGRAAALGGDSVCSPEPLAGLLAHILCHGNIGRLIACDCGNEQPTSVITNS